MDTIGGHLGGVALNPFYHQLPKVPRIVAERLDGEVTREFEQRVLFTHSDEAATQVTPMGMGPA